MLTAFFAGIASVVSPCVIALFPVYISILGGSGESAKSRFGVLTNAVGFASGFTIVFVLLGTGAGALGARLPSPNVMRRIAGIALFLMGLTTLGVVNLSLLSAEHRLFEMSGSRAGGIGFWGSVFLGIAFSAGWSPCVGPVLASILAVAGTSGGALGGGLLLSAYSAGLAVPFLVAAIALDRFKSALPGLVRASAGLRKIAGVMMLVVGVLYSTGIL